MWEQMQAFLNEFQAELGQDPFLLLTAMCGLVTLVLAVSGTVLDTRNQAGRLSRGGFLCVGFLVLGTTGEMLLTYAHERKQERFRQEMVAQINENTREMLEEYAEAMGDADAAEEELRRVKARGGTPAELEVVEVKLSRAHDRLITFSQRWDDEARDDDDDDDDDDARKRAARKVKMPGTMRRLLRSQKDNLRAKELLLKHKGQVPTELEGLSLPEVERLLEREGLLPRDARRKRD